jgi:hypothetical protein
MYMRPKVSVTRSALAAVFVTIALVPTLGISGEFVMKSGKGYGVCEALRRNSIALQHDRAQLCERKIDPKVKGLTVLTGEPLDPSRYADFLIDQLDVFEQQSGRHVDRELWRMRLERGIANGRVQMRRIAPDINSDGTQETWFWFYEDASGNPADPRCKVPKAVSMVFLLNETGDAFDYQRMRGLSRNGTRIIRYGNRTYVDQEFYPTGFGIYQESAAGFVQICDFEYQPLSEILGR